MPIDREEILNAIRDLADPGTGVAPGKNRFEKESGIRSSEWRGVYWARWGDAVADAGLALSKWQEPHPDEHLLASLAKLTRDLQHFPTDAERSLRRRQNSSFPTGSSFSRRFGRRADLASALLSWCEKNPGWEDVASICEPIATASRPDNVAATSEVQGVVYLMRSGRYFKIGRSNSAGRRAYELAIQLPERLEVVHSIETDDPEGIEAYWHRRFADRRANGEWFSLTKADVNAFRRRRRYM